MVSNAGMFFHSVRPSLSSSKSFSSVLISFDINTMTVHWVRTPKRQSFQPTYLWNTLRCRSVDASALAFAREDSRILRSVSDDVSILVLRSYDHGEVRESRSDGTAGGTRTRFWIEATLLRSLLINNDGGLAANAKASRSSHILVVQNVPSSTITLPLCIGFSARPGIEGTSGIFIGSDISA